MSNVLQKFSGYVTGVTPDTISVHLETLIGQDDGGYEAEIKATALDTASLLRVKPGAVFTWTIYANRSVFEFAEPRDWTAAEIAEANLFADDWLALFEPNETPTA
jgi:hypothetical protein